MNEERKFPTLRKVADHLRWNCDVRKHLYAVRRHILVIRAFHIESWKLSANGHKTPCAVCDDLLLEVSGVDRAIKHFGGKPGPGRLA